MHSLLHLESGVYFKRIFFSSLTSSMTLGLGVVSREHFQIWVDVLDPPKIIGSQTSPIPCGFFLTNFSVNGTLVNGVHLKGSNGQIAIHDGDAVSIPQVTEDGPQSKPLIEFRFDLSGSILQDINLPSDHAGTVGGA